MVESQFDVMTASFVVFEFNNNATDGDHYGLLSCFFVVVVVVSLLVCSVLFVCASQGC